MSNARAYSPDEKAGQEIKYLKILEKDIIGIKIIQSETIKEFVYKEEHKKFTLFPYPHWKKYRDGFWWKGEKYLGNNINRIVRNYNKLSFASYYYDFTGYLSINGKTIQESPVIIIYYNENKNIYCCKDNKDLEDYLGSLEREYPNLFNNLIDYNDPRLPKLSIF